MANISSESIISGYLPSYVFWRETWNKTTLPKDSPDSIIRRSLLYPRNEYPRNLNRLVKVFDRLKPEDENYKATRIYLAYCYENGIGTRTRSQKAFNIYHEAARHGFQEARDYLQSCYHFGALFSPKEKEALISYQPKEMPEIEDIAYYLGQLYHIGDLFSENPIYAFKWYQKAANLGNLQALYWVATFRLRGYGVPKKEESAFKIYLEAAKKGHIESLYNVACCYQTGIGVEKNEEKAFYYHRKAAEGKHPKSCYLVGKHYEKEDKSRAFEFYDVAAAQGHIKATTKVAYCYLFGIGVERNAQKGFEMYYTLATAPGGKNPLASRLLSLCYEHGIGTPINRIDALHWYKKSCEEGISEKVNLVANEISKILNEKQSTLS